MGVQERKEREKRKRREHIIKISEKLFLKKDIESITMNEIAVESELSKGALYIYFSSKEEIFLNIIYKAVSILYDLLSEAVSKADNPIFKLRGLGEAYIKFFEKYPRYYKLINKPHTHYSQDTGNGSGVKEIGEMVLKKTNEIWALSGGIISEGKKSGIFREDADPAEVSISLWAISTLFVGMMDQYKNFDHSCIAGIPVNKLDIKQLLLINGKRIIFSIMKNPPAGMKLIK